MKKILLLFTLVLPTVFSQAQVNSPTALKARQDGTSNQAIVEWAAPTGPAVTGYKVFYKVKGATRQDTLKTNTPNVLLKPLTLDTAYVVKVKAFRAVTLPAVDTTYSTNTDSVIVRLSRPLVKPEVQIETSFTTDTSITFHLVDNTNIYETGHEIRIEGGGQIFTLTTGPINGEEIITYRLLKPKTYYQVTARAIRQVTGETFPPGAYSDPKGETTKVAAPPAATAFKIDADCPYGVAFSWNYANRQEDIVYVDVEASFDGWNFQTIGSIPANQKNFYFSGAEPGVNYYYRVVTMNSTGTTRSGPFQIFTRNYVAPNPPKNLRSLKDNLNKYSTWLTAAWDHGDQDMACKTNIVTNTELRISINNGPWMVKDNFPNYIQQYRIDNLQPGDAVQISVRSYSDKGLMSDWVTTTDTTYGPPKTPNDFRAIEGSDNFGNKVMFLSWSNVENEGQYFIERSKDHGSTYQAFAFVKQDVTKLTDTHIEEGVSYFYRVKATNWVGESGYISRGPFSAQYSSAPNSPYGLVAKRNGNGVDLTWIDDTVKEEKYYVERSADGGQNYVVINELGRNTTKSRDEGISAGKTYHYRVRAWNSAFQSSPYSKPVSIDIPAATSGFVFDATVYPNPVSESLNIKAEGIKGGNIYQLRIFDSNNHLVLDKEIRFNDENIAIMSIRNLVPGAYNLTLSDGKDKVAKKIIKL